MCFIVMYVTSLKESNYQLEVIPPDVPKDYRLTLYNYKQENVEKVKKFLATLKNTPPKVPNYNENIFV